MSVHTINSALTENPRIRFNWGFWDGHADRKSDRPQRDMSTHFDPVYAAGYLYGFRMAETAPESSDEAWDQFLPHVEAKDPALAGELAAAAEAVGA